MTRNIIFVLFLLQIVESRHAPIYLKYKKTASDIMNYLLDGPGKAQAYNRLAELTDTFGPRMVGSQNLDLAINHIVDKMSAEGLIAYTEDVQLPNWVRGYENATLLRPRLHQMALLGLGTTVPTQPQGIQAEGIVVTSFDELKQLGNDDKISGKIVIFNQPWVNYGQSAEYRERGASEAAKYGAVAALIRSAASHSIYSPATGTQDYASGVPKIPTACITVEDAEMLHRMQNRNQSIEIFLKIDSHTEGTITGRNTIAEIRGSENPEEIILISGHMDSWDVGTGALDDGSGVIICWQALSVIRALELRPRRTIRAVFWTAEEQGYLGSQQYYERHKTLRNETFRFVAESDTGSFKPTGLYVTGSKGQIKVLREVLKLLQPINASQIFDGQVGGDTSWWQNDGVPGAWLQDTSRDDYYFGFHHTKGDTMNIYTPEELDYSSVLWTVMAYVLGDCDLW